MKLNTGALFLACLAVSTLFATSSRAQGQARQLRPRFHQAKPYHGDEADANKQPTGAGGIGAPTTACNVTFTSGSYDDYLQFCVTANGNIAEFQSPVTIEQIAQGAIIEGYGLCDLSAGTSYYDYATNDSGNWGPSTFTHTATVAKVVRKTLDGVWTLTQMITMVAGTSPYARVAMAHKNNSTSFKFAYLVRYADADPGGEAGTDTTYAEDLDASQDSAWAYLPSGYGLMISNVGNPTPPGIIENSFGLAQTVPSGPDPCNFLANFGSPITNTDGGIMYFYNVEIGKGQTVNVTAKYFSF